MKDTDTSQEEDRSMSLLTPLYITHSAQRILGV